MRLRSLLGPWLVALAVTPAGATEDRLSPQWNLAQIGAPAAWAASTGAGVTIGIVDSGVDTDHPELRGKVDAVASCSRETCEEGRAPDPDGHGTAVAAVAAASDGDGISGVAPGARLVVARALDDDGAGSAGQINRAVHWVVDHGARVVNLSVGDGDRQLVNLLGSPLRTAIAYAWSRGAIPVLAAGNDDDRPGGRGSFNYGDLDAVVVGATNREGAVSSYSSPLGNARWGVVAPGGEPGAGEAGVLTAARSGGYRRMAGTSFAAPHVSGTLALLLAQGLGPRQAVERLLATLDRSAPCGDGCQGRVRADLAVLGPPVAADAPVLPAVEEGAEPGWRARPGLAILATGMLLASAGALAASMVPTGARRPQWRAVRHDWLRERL